MDGSGLDQKGRKLNVHGQQLCQGLMSNTCCVNVAAQLASDRSAPSAQALADRGSRSDEFFNDMILPSRPRSRPLRRQHGRARTGIRSTRCGRRRDATMENKDRMSATKHHSL